MALTEKDITKIAHLARLEIVATDIPVYTNNLINLLNLIAEMNAVDTTNIDPMAHPLDKPQRLRPDIISEKNQRDYFQKDAPLSEAGLYLVPKVIE